MKAIVIVTLAEAKRGLNCEGFVKLSAVGILRFTVVMKNNVNLCDNFKIANTTHGSKDSGFHFNVPDTFVIGFS